MFQIKMKINFLLNWNGIGKWGKSWFCFGKKNIFMFAFDIFGFPILFNYFCKIFSLAGKFIYIIIKRISVLFLRLHGRIKS